MDRHTFLKALVSFGASIALRLDLATASDAEIDTAWTEAASTWDLFEVSEFRSLSYANFEEPITRYDAYGFSDTSDVDASMLESHYDLYDPIQALYREHLLEEDPALDEATLDERVEAAYVASRRGDLVAALERGLRPLASEAPRRPGDEPRLHVATLGAASAAHPSAFRPEGRRRVRARRRGGVAGPGSRARSRAERCRWRAGPRARRGRRPGSSIPG